VVDDSAVPHRLEHDIGKMTDHEAVDAPGCSSDPRGQGHAMLGVSVRGRGPSDGMGSAIRLGYAADRKGQGGRR